MRVLVTAGNTRERIDAVRDWGNIFSGNTGLGIAKACAEIAEVDLLTSNRQHIEQLAGNGKIKASGFTSYEELRGALSGLVPRVGYDAIFMTAAVADYRPSGTYAVLSRTPVPLPDSGEETPDNALPQVSYESWLVQDVQSPKVASTYQSIAVLGEPTEKIIDLFRVEWNHKGMLVKFKLEVGVSADRLLKIAEASRRASGADYIVANTLDMVTGPTPGAFLLWEGGNEWMPREDLAGRLRDLVNGFRR